MTELKPATTSNSSGSKSFFKSLQKGSGETSLDLPQSDVVQDLSVNKKWAGKVDGPFFLDSQAKGIKRAGPRGPGGQPSACLEPAAYPLGSLLCTVPLAGIIVSWRQLSGACVQSPSTEVGAILSHCYPSAH